MRRLVVLYDAHCGFCVRCRKWLQGQPQLVPLELLPAGSAAARARFPTLRQGAAPEELVVVDDAGGVYRESDAWLMCLYALRDYREWSVRLAAPALRPFARAGFEWLSRNRRALSRELRLAPERDVVKTLAPMATGGCDIGRTP